MPRSDSSEIQDPVLYHEWHAVARSEQVTTDRPVQVHLLGEAIVLWRSKQVILAFRDRCPHRGVALSMGRVDAEKTLVCPYHGMMFDEQGQCVRIPADPTITSFSKAAHVPTYHAQERYGLVWVCLGEPQQEIPIFDEWDEAGFTYCHCGPYWVNASAPRIVENFTDISHFPFIHPGLLGDPQHPEVPNYRLTVGADGITAHDIHIHQQNPDGTGEAKSVSYFYQIRRPLVAYFRKGDTTTHFSIFLVVTPVEETRSVVWLGISRNYAPEVPNEELQAFQDTLMAQDILMVEAQRPQKLPLDLQAEFHFPADKLSIVYRQWLKVLDLRFGTC